MTTMPMSRLMTSTVSHTGNRLASAAFGTVSMTNMDNSSSLSAAGSSQAPRGASLDCHWSCPRAAAAACFFSKIPRATCCI